MTAPTFTPRAVKLRHEDGTRALVIEGAAAVVDTPLDGTDARLGILVGNMTLLYLPEGWRVHTLPEGRVRYVTQKGEAPIVTGQARADGRGEVLLLVPGTAAGQEAIRRGTAYFYLRDLHQLVEEDTRVDVSRTDEGVGTLFIETSSGMEAAVAFSIDARAGHVAFTSADMRAPGPVTLTGVADDAAIRRAFLAWVRAAGEA